jgi:iron complex outermembrane receptor protein
MPCIRHLDFRVSPRPSIVSLNELRRFGIDSRGERKKMGEGDTMRSYMSARIRSVSASLLASVAISVVGFGALPASAQTTPDTTPSPTPTPTPREAAGLEEIVVTAQRRDESLQRAALAVTAVSGDELEARGTGNLTDITRMVPAVQIDSGAGPFTTFALRGVQSSALNAFGDPAVAVSIDGMYLPRPTSHIGLFYDIQRVEVLKGPQGTLYGRNTAAGVVNLITRAPELDELGGNFTLEAGSYDLKKATGALNVPLSDKAAFRAAFEVVDRDGYFSDGSGDDKHQAARAQLRLVPSDRLEILLRADYAHLGGRGSGGTAWCIPTTPGRPDCAPGGEFYGDPFTSVTEQAPTIMAAAVAAGLSNTFQTPGGIFWGVYNNFDFIPDAFVPIDPLTARTGVDDTNWSISAQVDWSVLGGTLTFIPTYRDESVDFVSTAVGATLAETNQTKQYTAELRFVSDPARRLNYILGAYYYKDTHPGLAKYDGQGIAAPPVPAGGPLGLIYTAPNIQLQRTNNKAWSIAAFANATYSVTDTFRITGGIRYTHDEKSTDSTVSAVNYFVPNFGATFPMGPGATDAAGNLILPNNAPGCNPFIPPFTGCNVTYPLGGIPATYSTVASRSWNNWSWKAGIEWDVREDSLLYATASTGYKAGGFFFSPPGTPNSYEPEKLMAYSLGLKNRFLDRRLIVNMEAFYWRYRDQQVGFLQFRGPFIALPQQNAERATIKGVELETQFLATPSTLLRANVQLSDAKYDKYTPVVAFISPPAGCSVVGPDPINPGLNSIYDCSGLPLVQSPRWTATFGIQQTIYLGNGGDLVLSVDSKYESERLAGFNVWQRIDGNTRTDGSITYQAPGGGWSVQGYVNNIEDDAVPIGVMPAFNNTPIYGTGVRPPRTFGVRVSADF